MKLTDNRVGGESDQHTKQHNGLDGELQSVKALPSGDLTSGSSESVTIKVLQLTLQGPAVRPPLLRPAAAPGPQAPPV
jgi:hypothetical protein